jgi:transposase
MLACVRPRDVAGKTRRRMAAEELADLVAVDAKLNKVNAELNGAVLARGSTLLEVHGIGPAGAARILADVGDVARFADRNRFASWTGTAPLDASSGEQIRHRLSRAGNRRLNHVLHIAAIVQRRNDTEGRAYDRRKLAAGKTPMEALRCLKWRLSDVIFRRLVADARKGKVSGQGTGPGRALRGDSRIQRGRPAPAHRHFGSATSRTRRTDATPNTTAPEHRTRASTQTNPLTQRGAR